MVRHLVVALAAWLGDLSISRAQLCAVLACGLVGLMYWWYLPGVLPLWPAVVAVVLATICGFYWDKRRADAPVVRRHAR